MADWLHLNSEQTPKHLLPCPVSSVTEWKASLTAAPGEMPPGRPAAAEGGGTVPPRISHGSTESWARMGHGAQCLMGESLFTSLTLMASIPAGRGQPQVPSHGLAILPREAGRRDTFG